jgi:hypothetical protein
LKTILLVIDHGLTLANFLLTDLARLLTDQDVRLVFLVQDELIPRLREEYGANPLLLFDSMREDQAIHYQKTVHGGIQELMEHIRGASMNPEVPMTYVDTHRQRKEYEAKGRWKYALKATRPVIGLLRHSRVARRAFASLQQSMFTPEIYGDLFNKYQPDLIVSATAGWRLDRYLLREANRRKIPTAMVTVGWDNPSAHGLPGAHVDYASVWSDIHKWELSTGYDWPKENIFVGGFPLYDGYISKKWLIPREEYFRMHGLDPDKRLVAYAATALSISPNLHIVQSMIEMIARNQLSVPSQLLIRLHPNHFKPFPHYQQECEAITQLASQCADVHVVAPKALAGGLPRYSGEDFPEKTSMLAHCDVLVSIYSTMVLEAALHGKPFVSVCIDSPGGWPGNYWIPLHEVPNWPTAARVNKLHAGRNAFTAEELIKVTDDYLVDPFLDAEARQRFVQQELTYLNGESTGKTAQFLLSLVNQQR